MGAASASAQNSATPQGQPSSGKGSQLLGGQINPQNIGLPEDFGNLQNSGIAQPIANSGGKSQSLPQDMTKYSAAPLGDINGQINANQDQPDMPAQAVQSLPYSNQQNKSQNQPQGKGGPMNNDQSGRDRKSGNRITYPTTSGQQRFGRPMQGSMGSAPYSNTIGQQFNQSSGKGRGA